MTGKHPGQHGVFDFFQKEAPGSGYFRFASSQDVRSGDDLVARQRAGRRVIVAQLPADVPAAAGRRRVVPGGWMPWRQLRLGCHPPGCSTG